MNEDSPENLPSPTEKPNFEYREVFDSANENITTIAEEDTDAETGVAGRNVGANITQNHMDPVTSPATQNDRLYTAESNRIDFSLVQYGELRPARPAPAPPPPRESIPPHQPTLYEPRTVQPNVYELRRATINHHPSMDDAPFNPPFYAVATNLSETMSQPAKEGYLEKLSGGKHRAPKWDKRYFEATTSGYLHYYKKVDGKPVGSIYLRGCPVQQDFENRCVILIETDDRDWQLRASSEEDAKQWVDVLSYYAYRKYTEAK